jgi:hypothetical protein
MFSASNKTTSCTLGMLAVLETCRTKLLSDIASMDRAVLQMTSTWAVIHR